MEEDDRENTEKQLWDYLADAHCHPAESLENASFEIIEKETKITKVQHFCQMVGIFFHFLSNLFMYRIKSLIFKSGYSYISYIYV